MRIQPTKQKDPSGWPRMLEKLALAVERPVNRLIDNTQLNPFYHTGTIAVFLLAVVAVTGFYLFLFFQYGFAASYISVAERIEAPIIARIMRAVHRYASGALVVTTLLHAFRMLFMERFRGPRWLAWLTGIVMTFILWLAGITGYWLIWDNRAQLINEHFARVLGQFTSWEAAYRVAMLQMAQQDTSWRLVILIFGAHVLLFGLTAVFFWLHIRRLSRPRWLPELHWMAGATAVLLLISALFPAGLLPPFDMTKLPGAMRLDPIFLYYLPLVGTGWDNWLWAMMWLATLVLAALPWVRRRGKTAVPPVEIIDDKCTGCTKCAQDCPYGALTMLPRSDDSGHQLIAVANPDRCVACGICVGSCDDFYAIRVNGFDPESMKDVVTAQLAAAQAAQPNKAVKLIFACERHTRQGAAPFVDAAVALDEKTAVAVVPLTCSGAIQPSILPFALAQGAAEVAVVGCPPYDCANRLGNMLEEARLTNERVPRLRRRYDHVPITAAWLPPDDFEMSLPLTAVADTNEKGQPDYLSERAMFQWLSWRNLLAGFVLLALVLLAQIWLTGLRYTPPPTPPAVVRVTLANPAGQLGGQRPEAADYLAGQTVALTLAVDDEVVWERPFTAVEFLTQETLPVHVDAALTPGRHHLVLSWTSSSGLRYVLRDEVVAAAPGDIVQLTDVR